MPKIKKKSKNYKKVFSLENAVRALNDTQWNALANYTSLGHVTSLTACKCTISIQISNNRNDEHHDPRQCVHEWHKLVQ